MKKTILKNARKYGFEFLSIFIAVISAFALNNWNDNRKDQISEEKILREISNGLNKDLEDIQLNILGHQRGLQSCLYFKEILTGNEVNSDSLLNYYFSLTRDFVSVQNRAGYETLKSKGLELLDNDSLRLQIISLYEYDYNTLRKLEEEYHEMQFHENYFQQINEGFAANFQFDSLNNFSGINQPLIIEEDKKKELLLCLWKIHQNRTFILKIYEGMEEKVKEVQKAILSEIEG